MIKKEDKRCQVWVETVIYTLIGLTIMGTIIAIITPRISQIQDNILIEDTKKSLNVINEQILDTVFSGSGNQREIQLTVKKGEYTIDAINNTISYSLKNTNLKYSQPNATIKEGDIYILTIAKGNKKYDINLLLDYNSFNLTFQNKDSIKVLTPVPVAYRFMAINNGGNKIDIEPI